MKKITLFLVSLFFIFLVTFYGVSLYSSIIPHIIIERVYDLNLFQSMVFIFNLFFLCIIVKNFMYRKKNVKFFHKLVKFLFNLKYVVEYLYNNAYRFLFAMTLFYIIGLIINTSFYSILGYSLEDAFIWHVYKVFFIYGCMSIFSAYVLNYILYKKVIKFKDALCNITACKFIWVLCFYTIFIYLGLSKEILVFIYPFLKDTIYSLSEIIFGIIKSHSYIKGFFNNFLLCSGAKKSNFMWNFSNSHLHCINKSGKISLNYDYSNQIKKSNFIRNLLFSKSNMPILRKNFYDLTNIVKLLSDNKLYVSGIISLKNIIQVITQNKLSLTHYMWKTNGYEKILYFIKNGHTYIQYPLKKDKFLYISTDKKLISAIDQLNFKNKLSNGINVNIYNKNEVLKFNKQLYMLDKIAKNSSVFLISRNNNKLEESLSYLNELSLLESKKGISDKPIFNPYINPWNGEGNIERRIFMGVLLTPPSNAQNELGFNTQQTGLDVEQTPVTNYQNELGFNTQQTGLDVEQTPVTNYQNELGFNTQQTGLDVEQTPVTNFQNELGLVKNLAISSARPNNFDLAQAKLMINHRFIPAESIDKCYKILELENYNHYGSNQLIIHNILNVEQAINNLQKCLTNHRLGIDFNQRVIFEREKYETLSLVYGYKPCDDSIMLKDEYKDLIRFTVGINEYLTEQLSKLIWNSNVELDNLINTCIVEISSVENMDSYSHVIDWIYQEIGIKYPIFSSNLIHKKAINIAEQLEQESGAQGNWVNYIERAASIFRLNRIRTDEYLIINLEDANQRDSEFTIPSRDKGKAPLYMNTVVNEGHLLTGESSTGNDTNVEITSENIPSLIEQYNWLNYVFSSLLNRPSVFLLSIFNKNVISYLFSQLDINYQSIENINYQKSGLNLVYAIHKALEQKIEKLANLGEKELVKDFKTKQRDSFARIHSILETNSRERKLHHLFTKNLDRIYVMSIIDSDSRSLLSRTNTAATQKKFKDKCIELEEELKNLN